LRGPRRPNSYGKQYLERYPDVKDAKLNPWLHYIAFGVREGRYIIRPKRLRQPSLLHFARKGYSLFRESYWSRNQIGIRSRKLNPVIHWILFGWIKGYRLFPSAVPIIAGDIVGIKFRPERKGTSNTSSEIPEHVIKEIVRQAEYEPALFASGNNTLTSLPVVEGTDLFRKIGFNFQHFSKISNIKPKTIIAVPHVVLGGADKYTSNLIDALVANGMGPVQVVLTLPQATFDDRSMAGFGMTGFAKAEVIVWSQIALLGQRRTEIFARYLSAMQPERLLIVNSDLALETMSRFGRALSNRMKILTAVFSMESSKFAGQYGVRYLRKISNYSSFFADNRTAISKMAALQPYGDYFELPSMQSTDSEERLKARFETRKPSHKPATWLWVSRLDSFKGTKTLGHIAQLRPNDTFHVFGPMQNQSLAELGLACSNIEYKGLLESIEDADLRGYEAFLFTSEFEGMPLILLEMANHAIPIISTDVGGIFNTFSEKSIHLVKMSGDPLSQAHDFTAHMDLILESSREQKWARAQLARNQVESKHSMAAVQKIIRERF
jgi:glycosyltransferase involved in cell wall biosynthesis